jgi:hypothetical protein
MPNLAEILRRLDAEVAVQRQVDDDAFTTADYARINGVSENTALRRLRVALKQESVARSWKASTAGPVPAWKLVKR